MIDLKKTSSMLSENYNYSGDNVMGTVNVQSNVTSGSIVSMNGQVYEKKQDGTQGAYIGNFNGQIVDGVMKYSTIQMTRAQYEIVMDLIGELEVKITKNNDD